MRLLEVRDIVPLLRAEVQRAGVVNAVQKDRRSSHDRQQDPQPFEPAHQERHQGTKAARSVYRQQGLAKATEAKSLTAIQWTTPPNTGILPNRASPRFVRYSFIIAPQNSRR